MLLPTSPVHPPSPARVYIGWGSTSRSRAWGVGSGGRGRFSSFLYAREGRWTGEPSKWKKYILDDFDCFLYDFEFDFEV